MQAKLDNGKWNPEYVRQVMVPMLREEGSQAALCRRMGIGKKAAFRAFQAIGRTASELLEERPRSAPRGFAEAMEGFDPGPSATAPTIKPLPPRDDLDPSSLASLFRYPWDEWCDEALEEVKEILRRNDAILQNVSGTNTWRFIPARKVAERLRTKWGVSDATPEHVKDFAKRELKRNSWRVP